MTPVDFMVYTAGGGGCQNNMTRLLMLYQDSDDEECDKTLNEESDRDEEGHLMSDSECYADELDFERETNTRYGGSIWDKRSRANSKVSKVSYGNMRPMSSKIDQRTLNSFKKANGRPVTISKRKSSPDLLKKKH